MGKTGIIAATLLLAAAPAMAIDEPRIGDRALFGSYDSNYLLLGNRMENNGWAGKDERAMRAHYSLRYVLYWYGSSCGSGCWPVEAFLDYTGEFDFYWSLHDTRDSGPVINRLSNPGGHVRWRPWAQASTGKNKSFVEAGYEHESNGQVTEVGDGKVAQRAYDERYRPYFDTISRGSNFVALSAYLVDGDDQRPYAFGAKLRLYTLQDYDVTWGPYAGSGVRLSDYHRLALIGRYKALDWLELDARWTIGDKGLKTDSFDLGATLLCCGEKVSIPIYLRYHRGPLNTLSNYTQRQDSFGVGLRLASF